MSTAALFTESADLFAPALDDAVAPIAAFLRDRYEHASVEVVECPNLLSWGLAMPGLGGQPRLVDVGGVPNLLDPAHQDKSFAIGDILDCAGLPTGCVLGAASGDAAWAKGNTELMPCASRHTCRSKSARVGADGRCVLDEYDWDRVGFLANLFVCQGVPGPVLEVRARGRRLPEDHSDNFVGNIRGALLQRFPGRAIGLGGAFTMKKGLFKAHVMPDFKDTVMVDGPEVQEWLKYYEMGPGATFLSTMLTQDPTPDGALNLRLEHTHFFNQTAGEGGHYHYGTSLDVDYVGYFALAERVYRMENAFDRRRCNIP
ncbi:unnamed protein product (mitochondrion) [Plasmodiophora brassicae]|uniref:DUF1907 domain-containing protein n=1 Tax=Plasmodiophora brassicae TaxID=37360 RepID=A0A0G4IS31_PLABS|nr:hypothetical protein PBRA_006131 [Plasmodiophora brassicae]SPQ96159.1 unnamed protein product [Plasmodiophora brassicae]